MSVCLISTAPFSFLPTYNLKLMHKNQIRKNHEEDQVTVKFGKTDKIHFSSCW
jgi:hypothetical protein